MILDDAIGEINRRFERNLPRLSDLDPDSFLASLWRLAVVIDDPPPGILFQASATDREFSFSGNLKGQLVISVSSGPDLALTTSPQPVTP